MAKYCSECGEALGGGPCRRCAPHVTGATQQGLRPYTPPSLTEAGVVKPGESTKWHVTGVVVRRELVRMDFAAGVLAVRQGVAVLVLVIVAARWQALQASDLIPIFEPLLLAFLLLLLIGWLLKRSATDGVIASLFGAGLRVRGANGHRRGWKLEIDTGSGVERVDFASDPPLVDYQRLTIHGPVIHGVRQAWLAQSVQPSLTEFGRGIIGNFTIVLVAMPVCLFFMYLG